MVTIFFRALSHLLWKLIHLIRGKKPRPPAREDDAARLIVTGKHPQLVFDLGNSPARQITAAVMPPTDRQIARLSDPLPSPAKWSQGTSSANDSKQDDHDSDYQKSVNETTHGVRGD
jgi:hypothetical protein